MGSIEILDLITKGLANGGSFNLDPNTVTMFGNLLAAAVEMDEVSGRPTSEQMEQLPVLQLELLSRFWVAVDQLKGWSTAPSAPAKPKLRLVDAHGETVDHERRRKLVVH